MTTTAGPQDISAALQQHEGALRRLGLKSLALFGSAARNAMTPDSDLDMLYEFEEGAATLDHLLTLQAFLENLFECNVDLAPRKYVGPVLQKYIRDDLVLLFERD